MIKNILHTVSNRGRGGGCYFLKVPQFPLREVHCHAVTRLRLKYVFLEAVPLTTPNFLSLPYLRSKCCPVLRGHAGAQGKNITVFIWTCLCFSFTMSRCLSFFSLSAAVTVCWWNNGGVGRATAKPFDTRLMGMLCKWLAAVNRLMKHNEGYTVDSWGLLVIYEVIDVKMYPRVTCLHKRTVMELQITDIIIDLHCLFSGVWLIGISLDLMLKRPMHHW